MHTSSSNQSYRLVFNEATGTWVAAPETARGRGKAGRLARRLLLAAALTGAAPIVGGQGLPQTPTPVGDRYLVTTSPDGNLMQIKQSSNQSRAVIDWTSFSIAKGKRVEFLQDYPWYMALNRVTGSAASLIEGELMSQGKIFLVNPNGIVFSGSAKVDTAGLLATTLNVSDANANAFKFSGTALAFTMEGSGTAVINEGELTGRTGAHLALVGPKVINSGTIAGDGGHVQLLAGNGLTLSVTSPGPDPLLPSTLAVTGLRGAEVHNFGTLTNKGQPIVLTAKARDASDRSALVNQAGTVTVSPVTGSGTSAVTLEAPGGTIVQTGSISASGATAGTITVVPGARVLIDGGQWSATSTTGAGGTISIDTLAGIEQTTSSRMDVTGATAGGTIRLTTAGPAWLSGRMVADGTSGVGGNLYASGRDLTLAAASLAANGSAGGGSIQLGQWQGLADAQRALRTTLTEATQLQASALADGKGGSVVIASQQLTASAADIRATGGRIAGNGGTVTIGSERGLAFGGRTDAGSATGEAGHVNLVGRDLSVEGAVARLFEVTPVAPGGLAPASASGALQAITLPNGRTVLVNPDDNTTGMSAGAVRMYERDGALVAVIAGRLDSDRLGSRGIQQLKDPSTGSAGGTFVIASPDWGGDGVATAGAVTRVDGAAPRSLVATKLNSLVGTQAGDRVGSGGVTALSNGHYVVNSPEWSNDSAARAGAATWRNGVDDAGMAGAVSRDNSLYGALANDRISSGGTIPLANGHYAVSSPDWTYRFSTGFLTLSYTQAGAVTWRDGKGASPAAAVASTNSFGGDAPYARVGSGGVYALTNGNFVVNSPEWYPRASGTSQVGAVTWINGFTGDSYSANIGGFANSPWAGNSLVGTLTGDQVGSGRVVPLANGHFVALSPSWRSGTGAVTWSSGTGYIGTQAGPTVGAVGAANSLIGSRQGDALGSGGAAALANGHYAVASPRWSTDAAPEVGAVTWRDGYSAGVVGELDGSNSLIGSRASSRVGSQGVTPLLNGSYVVNSPTWNSATATGAGAVTWRSGDTPADTAPVVVSASNSLIGTMTGDQVGSGGLVLLRDGNYVVVSPQWSDPSALRFNVGAVTWRDSVGNAGRAGAISAANSVVGTSHGDQVGSGGVVALEGFGQGGYLVLSPKWTNGSQASAGAATPFLRTAGKSGTVSTSNSFVGIQAGDQVGSGGAVALDDGGYAIGSPEWTNGDLQAAGAVTLAGLASTVRGAVSASNSLVGSRAAARLGNGAMATLSQGRALVGLPGPDATQGGPAIVRLGGNPGLAAAGSGAPGGPSVIRRDALEAAAQSAQLALKAHNDLAVDTTVLLGETGASRPVALALVAGRSVSIHGSVSATSGGIEVRANADAASNDLNPAGRGDGMGVLAMAQDAALSAPAGPVTVVIDGTRDVGTITLAQVNGTTLTVRSSALAIASASAVAKSREYDGTEKAELEGEITVDGLRLVNSNLSLVATGAFEDRHAGNQKAVNVAAALTGFNGNSKASLKQLDGKDLKSTTPVTASITRAPLTVNVALGTKEYDGTVTAAGATITPVMLNDADSLNFGNDGATATYDTRTAGADKKAVVDVKALYGTMVGNAAGAPVNTIDNYDITRIRYAAVTGRIDRRVIDGMFTAESRVYDGTGTATFTQVNQGDMSGKPGFITGDDVKFSATAQFSDANAGLNKQVTLGAVSLAGADAANYALRTITFNDAVDATPPAQVRGSNVAYANIDKRTVAVEYWAKDKTYDGSVRAETAYTMTNKVEGDDLAYGLPLIFKDRKASQSAEFQIDPAAATQTGTLSGASSGNYLLREAASATRTSAVIDPLLLDLRTSAADKVYDGKRDADVKVTALNVIGTDAVTLSATGSFVTKDVGTGKRVEVGILAGGTDAGNYRLPASPVEAQASITPRPVDFTATATSRVYDGTKDVTLQLTPVAAGTAAGAPAEGLVAGDLLTVAGTGSLASKDAGPAVPVIITAGSVQLGGADAANYILGTRTGSAPAAAITPRDLKVTARVNDKVYDGTTGASGSFTSDAIPGDSLLFTLGLTFADRNAGTGKTVAIDTSASNALSGPDAGNYRLASAVTANQAAITPAPLIATRLAPITKIYDGRRDMALTLDSPVRVRPEDNVSIEAQLQFPDKNVGTSRPLSWSTLALRGDDARNYYVQASSLPQSGEITPRAIPVALTAASKVYDGSSQAAPTFSPLNLIGGDVVTASGDAQFDNANAGAGKRVTAGTVSLAGRDALNYVIALPPGGIVATASIRPRGIDVSAVGVTRAYDGSTSASVTLRPADVVAGDAVQATGNAAFGDRNVGNDKAINVTDLRLTGPAAGNYVLNQSTTTARGSITPRAVDVTAKVQDKVYDGTTAAGMTYQMQQVVEGDEVQVAGQAAFVDPNAGAGKAVTASNFRLSGAGAGNYRIGQVLVQPGSILPKPVSVSGSLLVDQSGVLTGQRLRAGDVLPGDLVSLAGRVAVRPDQVGRYPSVSEADLVTSNPNYMVSGSDIQVWVTPPAGTAGALGLPQPPAMADLASPSPGRDRRARPAPDFGTFRISTVPSDSPVPSITRPTR